MVDVLTFMRGFVVRPRTLCTEPVVAYLKSCGDPLAAAFPARLQREIYARRGFRPGVACVASHMGYAFTRGAQASPGDPCIIRAPSPDDPARVFFGLMAQNEMFCAASYGVKLFMRAPPVLLVARKI